MMMFFKKKKQGFIVKEVPEINYNQALEIQIRKLLKTVDPEALFDLLPEERQKKMVESASKVFNEESFSFIIHSLINEQIRYIAEKTMTMEQMAIGRGTLNGLQILYEGFEALSVKFQESNKPKEEFDEYKII